MSTRTCPECGTGMDLHRADAVTCSTRCRSRRHRRLRSAGRPAPSLDFTQATPPAPRPTAGVPAELRSARRWVRWEARRRGADVAKVPVRADRGGTASVIAPHTWTDYAAASVSPHGDGLGYVLAGDGVACLDLDHCLHDGVPSAAARAVLERFPRAWVEVSPSGTGLHVWGRSTPAPGRRVVTPSGLHAELYSRGRYMTVTGRTFRAGDLSELLTLDGLA